MQDPQNQPKIVFFGTSEFAVPALKYLVQNGYHISGVFTQPEKPAGRLRITMPSPVKNFALESGIQVFEPHTLKDEEAFKHFKNLNSDICIVASYGKIIPKKFLELPKHGFLNIHPSLLPKYRGPSPIQTAILNGDKETGVAIMNMDEEVDHGSILRITNYELRGLNYKDTEKELSEIGAKLLLEVIPKYISGEIEPKEQDHSEATFTKKFDRHDGKIDWKKTAEEVYNQIQALYSEPGVWTMWQGKVLKIVKAQIYDAQPNHEHGEEYIGVVYLESDRIFVPCSLGHVELLTVQLEGKKEMDIKPFVNGQRGFVGSKLE